MNQQFKAGDWVVIVDITMPIKLSENEVKFGEVILANRLYKIKPSDIKLWQPKIGELFWGTRTLHPDYQYETRTELFQVKYIHDDGTLSLISPLDRNVYSLWIQPENLQEFMKTSEPFIGELPSFLKEIKND